MAKRERLQRGRKLPEPVVHSPWSAGRRVVVIGWREWMPTKERRRWRNAKGKQADRTAAENRAIASQWPRLSWRRVD